MFRLRDYGCLPFLTSLQLRFAVRYKYLGAQASHNGGFLPEIRLRMTSAASGYRELRKPIFANRHLSVQTRLRLLEALVLLQLGLVATASASMSTTLGTLGPSVAAQRCPAGPC